MVPVLSLIFQFLQSFYPIFGDRSKFPSYNLYHRHSHVELLFQITGMIQVFFLYFHFLLFLLFGAPEQRNHEKNKFLFSC